MEPTLVPLRAIRQRLDELAERRLKGLSWSEELEYIDLVRLEAVALNAREVT